MRNTILKYSNAINEKDNMKLRKNRKEKYHNNKPYAVDEFD
jgi:hypothetical protein